MNGAIIPFPESTSAKLCLGATHVVPYHRHLLVLAYVRDHLTDRK